ncbi:MAG: hypothetical protein KAR42_04830 [candidate division Zixibacteria bacterium]|nr:hypothetical protein [candidate division Zixibacteria bacterium]
MKALKIIVLFLACRLCWVWLDQCGADLGLGEALPFCHDCNGLTTTIRLFILAFGAYLIYRILSQSPEDTDIQDDDVPLGRTYLIHWHRIILLLAIVSYPLWIGWIDSNTFIPGPNSLNITRPICKLALVKGTLIWVLVMGFAVIGFRILHRD